MSRFVSTMRQNRNLFDGNWEISIINSDGSIQSNQTYRTSANFMKVDGRVFTCSKASASTEGFRIALYDANKTFLKRLVVGRNELSITVNEPTAIYIKICVQSTSVADVQVELGDKATSYIPYGLEKVSNIVTTIEKTDNLFDINTQGDQSKWTGNDGTYKYIGFKVGKGVTVTASVKEKWDKGLNFYCILNIGGGATGAPGVWLYHSTDSSKINTEATVTTTTEYIYLNCYVVGEDGLANANRWLAENKLMIEIGDKAIRQKITKHLITTKEVAANV